MGWSRVLLAVVAALFALNLTARADEPVTIRAAWVIAPSNILPIMLLAPGAARHAGHSYNLDAVHFEGTPPMVTALAAGQIDIALLSYSAFALAIENAGMTDIRAVADCFQDGVKGWFTDEYMVSKDSPIRTIDDLKGKVLATNGAGTAIDMGLRAMLRRHHLEDRKNVTIVQVNLSNMGAALSEHRVDLISAVNQVAEDPAVEAIARPLFTQRDALGPSEMIVWAGRTGFLKAHRAAVVDLLEDMLRARHWYLDPKNHDAALKIVVNFTKLPPHRFAGWLFTHKDYYRDPKGLPNLTALQSNINTQHELGLLKTTFDVRKYADLSYVKAAAARLDGGK